MAMAKDINGQDVKVGDLCVYVGGGRDRAKYRGRKVIVRDVRDELRVDDGVGEGDDVNNWRWSAWVEAKELAKV